MQAAAQPRIFLLTNQNRLFCVEICGEKTKARLPNWTGLDYGEQLQLCLVGSAFITASPPAPLLRNIRGQDQV